MDFHQYYVKTSYFEIELTNIKLLVRQSPAASPKKNITGPPRIVRDIAADLYNTIQKWNNLHIQGCQIVKQIGLIKSEILGSYSSELEEETDKLYKIVQSVIPYGNVFKKLASQMCALEKLQNKNEVLFISCTLNELKDYLDSITSAYVKELTVSQQHSVFFE